MYRAVIFDMDDTLIQTKKAKFAAHIHTAKKFYNLDITEVDVAKYWGTPFPQTVRGIYRDIADPDTLIRNYLSVTGDFPVAEYDGAREMLLNLSQDFQLGLLTATSRNLAPLSLREAGIDSTIFKYFQTSDDSPVHKPDPGVFLPALEYFGRLGIASSEIVYVGDAIADLQASRGAGIDFIAIAGHTTAAAAFVSLGATTVTTFQELLPLLTV